VLRVDPQLLDCLRGKPPAARLQLLTVARVIQKRGVVLRSRLAALVRYLDLRAAELRVIVAELEALDLLRVVGPGYQRRGVRYRWVGPAEPIAVDRQLAANDREKRVIDVFHRLNGGWCHHSCLLRRVSPQGIRARELGDILWRARCWGLVEMGRTPRGGRAYRWVGPGRDAGAPRVVIDDAAHRRVLHMMRREAARLIAERDAELRAYPDR